MNHCPHLELFPFISIGIRILLLPVACIVPHLASGKSEILSSGNEAGAIPAPSASGLWEGVPLAVKERGKWAFELGVGIISDDTPLEYLYADFDRFEGSGEGYTYNFTASYQIHEFDWRTSESRFQPTLELPFMLTLVDQNVGGLVPDVNFGVLFRWRDFPWNHHVYTTFGIGGGLSYAFDDWQADIERHEGEDRSKLKFALSFEFTFAAPSHPEHQLVLFVDHQSGGHLFDAGGVDAWGLGFRHLF